MNGAYHCPGCGTWLIHGAEPNGTPHECPEVDGRDAVESSDTTEGD